MCCLKDNTVIITSSVLLTIALGFPVNITSIII